MKRKLVFIFSAILPFGGWAQVPNPGAQGPLTLNWSNDLPSALKTSGTTQQPVLVDVGTDWSISSKKMDAETFADVKVQDLIKGLVLVKLNPETSDEVKSLVARLKVSTYPSVLILNYKGEVVAQEAGDQAPSDFQNFLSKNLALFSTSPLGYRVAELPPDDSLFAAIKEMPSSDQFSPETKSFYLLDQCDSTIFPDGTCHIVRRSAFFKLRSEVGNDNDYLASKYEASRTQSKFIYARILNTQGKGRYLDLNQVVDEPIYSANNLYWDMRQLTLIHPALNEGDIVDYCVDYNQAPVISNHCELIWNLGDDYSSSIKNFFTVHFPQEMGLTMSEVRCDVPIEKSLAPNGTETWQLSTTLKPQKLSQIIPPQNALDSSRRIIFSTPWTWDAFASWYDSLCVGQDKLTPEAIQKVAEIKSQSTDAARLAFALDQWVAGNIRYVAREFGTSAFQPHAVAETLHSQSGDCKDKALLLCSMLREAGMSSSLVILHNSYKSTFNSENAALSYFNHVIVAVDINGKTVYLDPTMNSSQMNWLPVSDCKAQAIRVRVGKGEIVTLPDYQPLEHALDYTIRITLQPNGSALVENNTDARGSYTIKFKNLFGNYTDEKIREAYDAAFIKKGEILRNFWIDRTAKPGEEFKMTAVTENPHFAIPSSNGALLLHLPWNYVTDDWLREIASLQNQSLRFYPSDSLVTRYEINIPEGLQLASTPANFDLETPFLSASQVFSLEKGHLILTDTYATKDDIIEKNQDDDLRSAYSQLGEHRDTVLTFVPINSSIATSTTGDSSGQATPNYPSSVSSTPTNTVTPVLPQD